MAVGFFVTLEGGEGAGKSTLARTLGQSVRQRGREVVLTREPGGAPGADAIRQLLVSGPSDRWAPLEEALLFTAARCAHLRHTIQPALARDAVVICDRYYDSTRAYQVAAGAVAPHVLVELNAIIEAPPPNLTLILDLPPAAGLARSRGRERGEDRFEGKALDFHERVRAEFLAIAAREPNRCLVVDATAAPEVLAQQAMAALEQRL
jgi:dTMP kinase